MRTASTTRRRKASDRIHAGVSASGDGGAEDCLGATQAVIDDEMNNDQDENPSRTSQTSLRLCSSSLVKQEQETLQDEESLGKSLAQDAVERKRLQDNVAELLGAEEAAPPQAAVASKVDVSIHAKQGETSLKCEDLEDPLLMLHRTLEDQEKAGMDAGAADKCAEAKRKRKKKPNTAGINEQHQHQQLLQQQYMAMMFQQHHIFHHHYHYHQPQWWGMLPMQPECVDGGVRVPAGGGAQGAAEGHPHNAEKNGKAKQERGQKSDVRVRSRLEATSAQQQAVSNNQTTSKSAALSFGLVGLAGEAEDPAAGSGVRGEGGEMGGGRGGGESGEGGVSSHRSSGGNGVALLLALPSPTAGRVSSSAEVDGDAEVKRDTDEGAEVVVGCGDGEGDGILDVTMGHVAEEGSGGGEGHGLAEMMAEGEDGDEGGGAEGAASVQSADNPWSPGDFLV